MKAVTIQTHSPRETAKLAERLARRCRGGEIFCLSGNLGSGKTTFVKGLAAGLKIDSTKVNSPTFVIMNAYDGKLPLYHFDLYRLETPQEIAGIGHDEFLYGQGVAVIEWAERFGPLMPAENLTIEFADHGDQSRSLRLVPRGKRYQAFLADLH